MKRTAVKSEKKNFGPPAGQPDAQPTEPPVLSSHLFKLFNSSIASLVYILTTNHMTRLETHNKATDKNRIGKQNASDLSSSFAAVPFSSPMIISAIPGDWTNGTNP